MIPHAGITCDLISWVKWHAGDRNGIWCWGDLRNRILMWGKHGVTSTADFSTWEAKDRWRKHHPKKKETRQCFHLWRNATFGIPPLRWKSKMSLDSITVFLQFFKRFKDTFWWQSENITLIQKSCLVFFHASMFNPMKLMTYTTRCRKTAYLHIVSIKMPTQYTLFGCRSL